MTCERRRANLEELAFGSGPSPQARAEIAAHLDGCLACRGIAADLLLVVSATRDHVFPGPPVAVEAALLRRIEASPWGVPRGRAARWLALGAGFVLGFALGSGVRGRGGVPDDVVPPGEIPRLVVATPIRSTGPARGVSLEPFTYDDGLLAGRTARITTD